MMIGKVSQYHKHVRYSSIWRGFFFSFMDCTFPSRPTEGIFPAKDIGGLSGKKSSHKCLYFPYYVAGYVPDSLHVTSGCA